MDTNKIEGVEPSVNEQVVAELKIRDRMSDDVFNEWMAKGKQQADIGEVMLIDATFELLMDEVKE